MKRKYIDTSIPRDMAERKTNTIGQGLSLDELARMVSTMANYNEADDAVSVRDPNLKPIPHSGVWHRGELTDAVPHLKQR